MANLEQSRMQSAAYVQRHNIRLPRRASRERNHSPVGRARDIPTLLHKLAEQNLRDGTHYPLPEIFDEDGRQATTSRWPMWSSVEVKSLGHRLRVQGRRDDAGRLQSSGDSHGGQARAGSVVHIARNGIQLDQMLVTRKIVSRSKTR